MNDPFSRRRFVRLAGGYSFAGAAGLALRASAGAQTATPGAATPVADDPSRRLLLRVALVGGFVPAVVNVTRLPLASVYADGSVITEGPMIEIYPQPILPNLRRTMLTPEGLAAVLDAAKRAIAPLDGRTLEGAPVTDMPDTAFFLILPERGYAVTAYALGFDEASVTDPALRAGRGALSGLRDLLFDLQGKLGPDAVATVDEAFAVDRLRIYARPIDPTNPPDPSLPQEPMDWPLAEDLAAAGAPAESPLDTEGMRCAALAGEDAAAVVRALERANQLTPWVSNGVPYQVAVRPLLPDEPTACTAG